MDRIPTEAEEHKVLVAYLRMRGWKFHHSANETGSGQGARFQGIRNKRLGTSPGWPDLIILIGSQIVAIELKRRKGGKVSPEQKEWLKTLSDAGVDAFVSRGAQEAIEYLEKTYKRNDSVEF